MAAAVPAFMIASLLTYVALAYLATSSRPRVFDDSSVMPAASPRPTTSIETSSRSVAMTNGWFAATSGW
jgi:hypothetical protein